MSVEQGEDQVELSTIQLDLEVDSYLQSLVAYIDGTDDVMEITLTVGGLLVTGKLVSAHKFHSSSLGNSEEDLEAKERLKNDYKIPEGPPEKVSQYIADTAYIHLQDAKIAHPSGNFIPGTGGVWWRGKIKSVDGFFLGSLSYTQD